MIRRLTIVSWLAVALALAGCSPPAGTSGTAVIQDIAPNVLQDDPPQDVLILDVRTPGEYAEGHVPGAKNVPYDQIGPRLSELDLTPDRPVVVYCKSGKRAAKAAQALVEAGQENVLHLTGDMDGWKDAGRPISMN
jgi:rhodanese-related sulfurtransferase